MLDHHELYTRPSSETDRRYAYEVKRAALGAYVDQVWGWDEEFQQEFHTKDWQVRRPEIIVFDGQDVGTLEYFRQEDHYHVGEFYLLPEYQRRGIGTELLERMLSRADHDGLPVRLEVLKINPARGLYERHGFLICGETETHFWMIREPATSTPRA